MVRPRPLSGRCSATIYLTRAVTTARTLPASNGPKCTCTVVAVYPVTSAYHARDSTCHAHSLAVYPVTSAYHARDSTCHAHSLAFVKFEVPFLPIDPRVSWYRVQCEAIMCSSEYGHQLPDSPCKFAPKQAISTIPTLLLHYSLSTCAIAVPKSLVHLETKTRELFELPCRN